ncbi:alpha/beta hydrolase [Bacteroides acidifaciens]|uniref:alpha/beta hydrolase n=1 Tax=Bacteroides acidifaciens TaxID=85831 RepID=UPI002597E745|nr:alpha/beta fold hydrolase [Bacteroides acidifaciens]
MNWKYLCVACLIWSTATFAQDGKHPAPLVIQEQGSFMVGGTIVETSGTFKFSDYLNPAGQKAYADHAYVFYQIPVNVRKLPLVFLHGGGQSGKTWETTPDGREGFQNIFLRRQYGCYIVDQPRRGRAGSSSQSVNLQPQCIDKMLFSLFRFGQYPELYPDTQFPKDPASLEQLQRWATPDTGPYDDYVTSDAMAALFDKTGAAVLVSHSRGGHPGWLTALKSPNVKGIISLEPGGWKYVFPFPEGELPEPVQSAYGLHQGEPIPLEEFKKLTRIPILIIYGDFIADSPVDDIGQDQWRVEMQMARAFAETVNRHGGNAKVIHLPEIGIKGNTHFLMADQNNVEIADLMETWMTENSLEK